MWVLLLFLVHLLTAPCAPVAAPSISYRYPKHHHRHGPYSVDLSSARAVKVTAEEATARLTSAPSYLKEWPSCYGSCIDGKCMLKYDHPACCGIHRHTHYDVEVEGELDADKGAVQSRGHWEGEEWWCWD